MNHLGFYINQSDPKYVIGRKIIPANKMQNTDRWLLTTAYPDNKAKFSLFIHYI